MEDKKILDKLREICLALPKTSETTTFGHPTFQVGTKTFTVLETCGETTDEKGARQ